VALQSDGPAPYGPPSALIEVIERYRERGLQTPLTDEVLVKAGVSESVVRRVAVALKLLDLVDADMNPTEALKQYQQAATDDAKAVLEKVIRDAYEPVFSFVNPAIDPPERVRDAFRSYEPRGQQDRMVTLYMGLCRYVGIAAEPADVGERLSEARRQRILTAPARARARAKTKESGAGITKTQQQFMPSNVGQAALPAAVEGLVRELATIGPGWSRERRDQFMQVWTAVVDFSYPPRDRTTGHDTETYGRQGEPTD
jgi:hypothetical protein